jgi:predicted secreted Zn-dependent protease
MGSKPKPSSHVASVAGRRVRDQPEISKAARRFQARLSRRITEKVAQNHNYRKDFHDAEIARP